MCKMANLVLTILLDWLEEMVNMSGKSYMIGYMMIIRIFGTSKSFTFEEITKKYLINSTP